MSNPWENIPLKAYENHMSLADVAQLQALNRIMRTQLAAWPKAVSVTILGIAGGNGLEHCGDNLGIVTGIDVNQEYLAECRRRFGRALGSRLQLKHMDLTDEDARLEPADLLIADLLIEYIGVRTFCKRISEVQAEYVSCVIQSSGVGEEFISQSPYQEQLKAIGELHRDVSADELCAGLMELNYVCILECAEKLPNGKRLVRLDFRRGEG